MTELNTRPWLSIWVKPQRTVRAIIEYNVKYRFFLLSTIYGLPIMFQTAQNASLGGFFSASGICLLCILLAPIVGSIGLLLSAFFLTWVGRCFGGKSSFMEMRCAVSWSNSTALINVLTWGSLIYRFRDFVFFDTFFDMPMTSMDILWLNGCAIIDLIVAIWFLVLLVRTVSEVQRFAVWKGCLNVVAAFVVGTGVSMLVLLMIQWMSEGRV